MVATHVKITDSGNEARSRDRQCESTLPRPSRIVTKHEHSVELAGRDLGGQRHICAFFNTMDEEHRVLGSFYKDGFDRGEKATHIVDAQNRDEYLQRLAAAGVNVRDLMDTGQLEVLPWTDMYVRDHRFDQEAMLASVEQLIQSGGAAGYARTRLVGHHMDWLFRDKPAVNNLVEYEARLNHLLSRYDDPVICNYDLSKFSASVAIDIMRTHPLVIIGGLLRENPFFVPPEEFLEEIGQRRLARKTVA
jgi:MEDS: MEthanogen/methylotroph, DcmR Sensory domain